MRLGVPFCKNVKENRFSNARIGLNICTVWILLLTHSSWLWKSSLSAGPKHTKVEATKENYHPYAPFFLCSTLELSRSQNQAMRKGREHAGEGIPFHTSHLPVDPFRSSSNRCQQGRGVQAATGGGRPEPRKYLLQTSVVKCHCCFNKESAHNWISCVSLLKY